MSVESRSTGTRSGLPLVEELTPAPDSWEVARRLAGLPHLLFLDSVDPHPERGRYSFVAADPAEWLDHRTTQSGDPFTELQERLEEGHLDRVPGLPPFQGGLAGLWGYGLQHLIERIPYPRHDEFGIPDLALGVYDWVIAFDHLTQQAWIISTGYPEVVPARRLVQAQARLEQVRGWLANPLPQRAFPSENLDAAQLAPQYPLEQYPGVSSNFSAEAYRAAIARAVEYVHAGDCFQVNLAQRLLAPLTTHPLELYDRLRTRNPAPFAAYFDLGDAVVASASPERFLQCREGEVVTRPIKGTRRRRVDPAEDRAVIDDLRHSPKDRAENVMIVDLLRNDLGRVCEYGTVRVPKVCELETFSFVHHLVSEVRGQLRADQGPIDLLKACFPGGSVTGAPKVRAMEIIAELEPTARGPYCGSLGYIGFDGTLDTNILIRTFTAARGWLQFPVGGGIVADSLPEQEYQETLDKAAGLLRSLQP
jgi:para-aminobenzoate synthetase component 1